MHTLKTCLLACGLAIGAAPAHAAISTLPFIGDVEHPDMDPFHVMAPEASAAAASAPKSKKHHRMKKRMVKKKM